MSAVLCHDCCLPVFDLMAKPTEDGKLYHLACAERIARDGAEDTSLKVYEVDVHYSGKCRIRVVARTDDEAEQLARDGDIDTWDMNIDIDGLDLLEEPPTEWERTVYFEREERAAARRAARARAEQNEKKGATAA